MGLTTATVKSQGAATAMQIGLLYESSLAGKPWVNLEQIVARLDTAKITPDRLRLAWDAVALRHDALRTIFRANDGEGLQLETHETPDFSFETRALATGESLQAFLAQDRLRGADPTGFPNWRVTCLTGAESGPVMVWTIHHALVDGSGMETVLADLIDHLRAPDKSPPVGENAALVDFADRVAQLPQDGCRAHFQKELANTPATARFFQPEGPSPERSARRFRRLDATLSAALRDVAKRCEATPVNVYQAAWALVLARWTGQSGAVLGLVDSGRGLISGYEQTAGCFITTLPLAVDFAAHSALGPILAALRQKTIALRNHAHTSLSDIRRWTNSAGTLPLFETILMYDRATLGQRLVARGGLSPFLDMHLHEEGAAAATLAIYDEPEALIELEFMPDRLPLDRADAAFDHLLRLLSSIAKSGPDTDLGTLAMLSAEETAELLALSRPAHEVTAALPCIATRFEAVARLRPDSIAVVDAASDQQMTFQTLDRCANFMAQQLISVGIGPGDVVALHVPRGLDFVISLLASLKAGAAFMPLSPDQPQSYLEDLVRSARCKAVIAPPSSSLRKLPLLHVLPQQVQQTQAPPRPQPDENRLAYVIHTSGSTGKPKGVMGLTGALSAHASAIHACYGLQESDRVLHFAGLGFDVALEEIIPSLLAGARVVLRDDSMAGAIPAFLSLVEQQAITVLNLPASFWHVLVDECVRSGQTLPASVRLMITGSERINPSLLQQWRALMPDLAWINGYGPTEATITATAFCLPALAPVPEGEVPIGRPLGHARAYLRAIDGSLAPRGAPGALWLGGAAVTGGYLDQPEATAAAFRADPWVLGGRVYDSGDLAEWSASGQLMFHGRKDRQVKLRGYRIDLHQIEDSLSALPEVRQVHVAIDAESGGTPRLLAWLVCHDGPSSTDLGLIRNAAARRLPAYMMPSLIAVGRLPVGPNGKIDTRDLPRPILGTTAEDAAETTPRDSLAATIAQCMAKVLDLDFLPTDANFFDAGGESLLALRLVSLIETRTGRGCRASDLNSHPTPASLAQMLREGAQGPRFIVPIQPKGTKPALFAVHVLGNGGELFRPLSAALGPDYPVFGLTVGMPKNLGEIDVQRTARVYFEELQRHHPTGPLSLCAVSMAAYFAFELAQLLREAGREVRVLAVLDAMGPDGRPALSGIHKLRAHLGQFRLKGLGHLRYIRDHRLQQLREMNEARRSDGQEINGYNLIAANVRAVETYVPLPYEGRLTIFRAAESFWDSLEAKESGLGWASVALGGMEIHDLPGDHLSILYRENVHALARHLTRLMDAG
jgi:amino acid adenylation domain-containing protein